MGGQDPQTWKINGPERAAAFSFIESTPSFQDALAGLRSVLWHSRILSNSEKTPLFTKNINSIINVLAYAA
jgi:hypothetical protein